MSKGPGRVQRAVLNALEGRPRWTSDIAYAAYQPRDEDGFADEDFRLQKWQLVAVRRALGKLKYKGMVCRLRREGPSWGEVGPREFKWCLAKDEQAYWAADRAKLALARSIIRQSFP